MWQERQERPPRERRRGWGRWRAPRAGAARARPRGARFDRPPRRRGRTRGRTGQRPSCGSTPGRRALGTRRDRWRQLELSEPDLERRLADEHPQFAADPLPISEIAVARGSELLADRVELDDDGALSLAAPVGDVVLNDRDRLGAAPPVRGVGGVVVLLVPWFPPRARVGRRGFCRGFCRGFAGLRNRPILTGV